MTKKEINLKNGGGDTALMMVARQGDPDLMRTLQTYKQRYDDASKRKFENDALIWGFRSNNLDKVKAVINNKNSSLLSLKLGKYGISSIDKAAW